MSASVLVLLCLMRRFNTDNALAFFSSSFKHGVRGTTWERPFSMLHLKCRHLTSAEILIPSRQYTWGNRVEVESGGLQMSPESHRDMGSATLRLSYKLGNKELVGAGKPDIWGIALQNYQLKIKKKLQVGCWLRGRVLS